MSILDSAERLHDVTAVRRDGRDGALVPEAERTTTMDFRIIMTTGLAALYVVGCVAALSLLLSMWSPFL